MSQWRWFFLSFPSCAADVRIEKAYFLLIGMPITQNFWQDLIKNKLVPINGISQVLQ